MIPLIIEPKTVLRSSSFNMGRKGIILLQDSFKYYEVKILDVTNVYFGLGPVDRVMSIIHAQGRAPNLSDSRQ